MNSVHELGPNGDSKISPSRKTVRKTKPDAQAPSWPSRHAQVRTGACMAARGRSYRGLRGAVSWVTIGRVAGPTAVSWPCDARPCALCRAHYALAPARLAARIERITARKRPYRGRVPRAPLAVSWALAARQPSRIAGTVPRAGWPCPRLSHDTALLQALIWSQYTKVYCDTKTQQPVLFMSQNSRHLAIQYTHCPPKLQYTSPIAIQFANLLAIQFSLSIAIHMGLMYTQVAIQSMSCNIIGQ